MSYDLTGEKISYTYGRVVQVVSGSYYDGFGNVLPIGTSSVVLTGSTAGFATTGSNTFIGNQIISGSIVVVNGITSSLNGTASYSNNSLYADTASYYNGSVISSSYALSSSYTNTSSYSNNSISASYTLTSSYAGVSNNSNSSSYSLSGSFSITASYALNGGSNLITGSTYPITSSWSINSLSSSTSTSSSYTTTSSYSNNSISASYSLTSSYSGNSTSASYALTASYYNGSVISSSYSLSSSYARTASYAENSATSSYCINPFPISGSLGYWGSFWDSTTQNNDSASNAMRLGVSDPLSNGVRIVSGSKIHFDHDGVYNVQFSAVFNKPNASSDDVNVWVVKNGNNLSDTNTLFSVAGQSTSVAAWNFVLSLVTGDELQLYWHSNASTISILNYATQSVPSIPATPSLIVTATQVTNTQIAASASYAATSSYALNGGTTLTTGSTYPITSSWTNNSLTASSINFTASNAVFSLTSSYIGSGSNNYFPFWSGNKLSYNSLISQSTNQISILSDTASFLGNTLLINKSDPFYVNNNPTIDASNSPNQTLMLTPNVMIGGNGNAQNWNRFNSDGTVDFLGSNIKFTSGGSATFNSNITIGSLTLLGNNTLDVIGNVSCSVITASRLFGTADTASYYNGSVVSSSYSTTSSYSNNSISSSYALSSSYATTASYAPTNTNITASWSNNSLTASYLTTTNSYNINNLTTSGSITTSGSVFVQLGGGFSGQLVASGNSFVLKHSNSNNHIQMNSSNTTQFSQVCSFVNAANITPGGNNTTYALSVTTGSYSSSYPLQVNGNWLVATGSNIGIGTTSPVNKLDVAGNISASTITASLFFGTSSWSNNSISASYAPTNSNLTASYAILASVSSSLNFTDDTAAAAGGVPLGGLYRNGNFILIRLS